MKKRVFLLGLVLAMMLFSAAFAEDVAPKLMLISVYGGSTEVPADVPITLDGKPYPEFGLIRGESGTVLQFTGSGRIDVAVEPPILILYADSFDKLVSMALPFAVDHSLEIPEKVIKIGQEQETEEPVEGPFHFRVLLRNEKGKPVEGATAVFCSDTVCMPVTSDKNGEMVIEGEMYPWQFQLLEVPKGYSMPQETETVFLREGGTMLFCLRPEEKK